jgi:hypothetical protein
MVGSSLSIIDTDTLSYQNGCLRSSLYEKFCLYTPSDWISKPFLLPKRENWKHLFVNHRYPEAARLTAMHGALVSHHQHRIPREKEQYENHMQVL